jgi:hypothetical protein
MNLIGILGLLNLFLAGLLAGEEVAIYYGVRLPLASLEERPQLLLRQALIRTLRILVPAIFLPALLTGIAATVLDGLSGLSFVVRCVGLLGFVAWMAVTLPGTARINSAILDWNPDALPPDWLRQVKLWERFASVRPWAAMIAFGSFLLATML